jgi:hypothetical protein
VASCENDKLRNSQAAPPFFETNVDRTPLMREQHESHRERIEPAATPTVSETRFVHQVRGSSGVGEENFPPCNALKTHEMGKESRFWASAFHAPAERLEEDAARSAPLAIRVLGPARASTNAVGRLGRAPASSRRKDRDGNFPPRKALKTHKMGQESQLAASNPTGSLPQLRRRRGATPAPCKFAEPMLGRQSPSGRGHEMRNRDRGGAGRADR